MSQKPRRNRQDEEIAELKAELKRAYRVIEQLRHQNAQLQSLIPYSDDSESQRPGILDREEPSPSLEMTSNNLRRNSAKTRRYSSGESLSFLSQFQFWAITIAVATIFVIIGLVLTQRKAEPPLEPSSQPSINLPQQSNLPSPSPSPTSLPSTPPTSPLTPSVPPLTQQSQSSEELVYQFLTSDFQKSEELQRIVDAAVRLAKNNNLSTENLSISIIDVNSGEIAGYQSEKLRYPASVVKLFWLVVLYSQFAVGMWSDPGTFTIDIQKMIKLSDNEATSRILDALTNTQSGPELSPKKYQTWLAQRYWLNRFFQKAGYQGIDISQKTFPIPSENLYEPKGRDLQMRGDLNKPIRNKISTQQAARLMYEIVTERAIAPEYSQSLKQWLTWDLTSENWKSIDPNTGRFNPIRTFFGESLPTDVYFASKAGWTASTRQEVAFVSTRDGRTAYILAVFAEDPAYAKNGKIFPKLSRQVLEQMTHRR